MIHLETGAVNCLSRWPEPSSDPVFPHLGADAKEMMKSWTVLGTDGGRRVVATRSSLSSPVEVVVAEVDETVVTEWKVVKKTKLSARGESERKYSRFATDNLRSKQGAGDDRLDRPPSSEV